MSDTPNGIILDRTDAPAPGMFGTDLPGIPAHNTAPKPVTNPEYPDGDPRRHWPRFEALPGLSEDFSDIVDAIPAEEENGQADKEKLTWEAAMGLIPKIYDGIEFYVKLPKIKALRQFKARVEAFQSLPEDGDEALSAAVFAVLPLLRRAGADGDLLEVAQDEAEEHLNLSDVFDVIGTAVRRAEPGPTLVATGHADPKAQRGRKQKTGR